MKIIAECEVNGEIYFSLENELGRVYEDIPAKDLASDSELEVLGLSKRDIARIYAAAFDGLMESTTFH